MGQSDALTVSFVSDLSIAKAGFRAEYEFGMSYVWTGNLFMTNDYS